MDVDEVRADLGDRLGRALASIGEAPAGGDETAPENLAWMCRTAREGLGGYPVDKVARWLGFVEGCLGLPHRPTVAGTPPSGPLLAAHVALFDRYAGIARASGLREVEAACASAAADAPVTGVAALSHALGRIQGDLARRGLVRVREERDVSRPLFHAAYALDGPPPPTLDGPGSRA